MIPLLPFTFVKMNWDYFRDLRNQTDEFGGFADPDKSCILLMPTSEEGMASVERITSLAESWKNTHGGHPVVVTTNEMMASIAPRGCALYLLPDPKAEKGISRTEWNQSCANMLKSVIDTHQPFAFVFDGPFPYRGVLNVMEIRPDINTLWLRPTPLSDPELIARGDAFDNLVSLSWSELDASHIQVPLLQSLQTVDIRGGKRLLIATGYDRREAEDRKLDQVLRLLKPMVLDGWTLVISKNATSEHLEGFRVERWNAIGGNPQLSGLGAAITGGDPSIIRQLLACDIPTLAITTDKIGMSGLRDLREESLNGGLMVLNNSDDLELKMMLSTLLDDSRRESLKKRRRVETGSDWNGLFDLLLNSV